jgi:hypothetical protein
MAEINLWELRGAFRLWRGKIPGFRCSDAQPETAEMRAPRNARSGRPRSAINFVEIEKKSFPRRK